MRGVFHATGVRRRNSDRVNEQMWQTDGVTMATSVTMSRCWWEMFDCLREVNKDICSFFLIISLLEKMKNL